jgi:hypothetical protein
VCMGWARTEEARLPGLRQRPLSEGSVTMPRRSSLSRMQGMHVRIERGMGDGPAMAPRP